MYIAYSITAILKNDHQLTFANYMNTCCKQCIPSNINCVICGIPWTANNYPAGQEITCTYETPRMHYRLQKPTTTGPHPKSIQSSLLLIVLCCVSLILKDGYQHGQCAVLLYFMDWNYTLCNDQIIIKNTTQPANFILFSLMMKQYLQK